MGKTSTNSRFNLPGRYAWALAELTGPINLLYILLTLPSKLDPAPHSTTSFLGTGLPAQYEILACLYLIHYANRAVVGPLYLAPSMSQIHPTVAVFMALHQFANSSNIASGLVYSALGSDGEHGSIISFTSVVGLFMFFSGLAGNIRAENTLFDLRRGAAKRKARSEGRVQITYDKVYVVPPPEGPFKYVLFPHYVYEWLEWTGFWILAGAWGLGWGYHSPALWFLIVEVATMLPRAVAGRRWYEQKFGKRAVAGRAGAIPGLGL
ncbi:hypothetical protein A1O3_03303 [Capronia epimyces CBS 606.96]|uniref:3-oxo-5-alpha-steroid 4-dehydrogenase C-terminal domain-containing protein n=1 Tax=Capronia epimyces CBS 606.96 TaxID=1182542 RepID=W9Y0Q4_9EURO|nr:uncharacterized protein A1O3_03303 [Capronia epimyces CBS 606.96]EXJ86352.1 hypothetical protein A1O3_03303 [Capronia epimyces CBS 606.96]